jgi:hypothetical protein
MDPFFNVIATMVGSRTALPKYEPLKERAHLPAIEEEEGGGADRGPLYADVQNYNTALRLKIIGLGLCVCSLVLTFLLLVVFGLIVRSIVTHVQPNTACQSVPETPSSSPAGLIKPGTFTCGSTAEEARALGCKWDIMTASWEHPDCFDPDLTREFEELGPWRFYWSSSPGKEIPTADMLTPIPPEQVSEQPMRIWTDRRYHITHCIYAWKMMHRAVERGWKMQGELASYHHTEHCSQALANTSVPLDAIITKVNVQYPTC